MEDPWGLGQQSCPHSVAIRQILYLCLVPKGLSDRLGIHVGLSVTSVEHAHTLGKWWLRILRSFSLRSKTVLMPM